VSCGYLVITFMDGTTKRIGCGRRPRVDENQLVTFEGEDGVIHHYPFVNIRGWHWVGAARADRAADSA
jgi:hypothetical protein